jgi:hypothetical protein
MTTLPALDYTPAMLALSRMLATFPHLPAPHLRLPELVTSDGHLATGIRIEVHGGSADFEQWRAALGISPKALDFRDFTTFTTVGGFGRYDSVAVQLVGFLPPLPSHADVAKQGVAS